MTLWVGGSWSKDVTVFIDTGSEVSLVKRGLLPEGLLQRAKQPLQLLTASGQPLRGGAREVQADLKMVGTSSAGVSGKRMTLSTPSLLMEAEMEEDVLLSYQWLGDRDFDIYSRDHGLMGHVSGRAIWVPGIVEGPPSQPKTFPVSVRCIPVGSGKRALDLFCGRKSATLALEQFGFQVGGTQ